MNAYIFRIDLPNGRRQAVVCVDARYASTVKAADAAPERLLLSETAWFDIARELSQSLQPTPLPRHSAVVSALVEPELRSAARVRYLMVLPVDPSPDDDLERRLDALHVGFGGLHPTGWLW